MLLQQLHETLFSRHQLEVYVYRLDLLPPHFSGNKWFKLKYNLERAQQLKKKSLLSFGGAYSNHIYELASIGKKYGLNTIGIIRGEFTTPLNPILSFAKKCGMRLVYVDRATYREKHSPEFIQSLRKEFGNFYLIPEGGSNAWAVKGCKEIVSHLSLPYDYICTPCGTAGTLAGLVAGVPATKEVLGFAVLKNGAFLKDQTLSLLHAYEKTFQTTLLHKNFTLCLDYHLGGYAKKPQELLSFIENFIQKHHIPIEWIYTGKMLYGIYDLIQKGFFKPYSKIVALHTGGLLSLS